MDRRPRNDSYRDGDVVYAIQHPASGCIKIGKTQELSMRFCSLRSDFGPLRLLGTLPGYTEMEAYLHFRFYEHRILSMGGNSNREPSSDWFTPAADILEFIDGSMVRTIRLPMRRAQNRGARSTWRWRPMDFEGLLDHVLAAPVQPIEFYEHGDGLTAIAAFREEGHGFSDNLFGLRRIPGVSVENWFWHNEIMIAHVRLRDEGFRRLAPNPTA